MQDTLKELEAVLIARRNADPDDSYVASLYAKGREQILKKVGEEAVETVLAGMAGERDEVVHEVADLIFHVMVMLQEQEITIDEVAAELQQRFGRSGHAEKAAREH